jgi:hypothetical protein
MEAFGVDALFTPGPRRVDKRAVVTNIAHIPQR